MPPAIPLCYVGKGLGAKPKTPSQVNFGTVEWDRFEKKVRMVPALDAESLLRENPEDFRRCVELSEGHGGLTGEQLAALGDGVHVEMYHPKAGGDVVPVLVLDEWTAAGIATAKAPKKPSKKDKGE